MIKNYYQVLGVEKSADSATIKSAYRSLAVRFHPDKSPDPGAHNRFVEINEAYQVLNDPQKRLRYNYLYDTYILGIPAQRPVPSRGAATQARYRQTPPANRTPFSSQQRTGRPKYARSARGRTIEEIKLAPWARSLYLLFSASCLVFVLAIAIDFFMPLRYKNALLEDYIDLVNIRPINSGLGGYYIDVANQQVTIVNPQLLSNRVILHTTDILGLVREVTLYYNGVPLTVRAAYSLYDSFIFLPLALLVTSVLGLVYRKSDLFTLRISFASLFVFIITCLLAY
jgi:hypothetical protein